MNCRDYEKRIPDFIADTMNLKELTSFIEHVDQCESCKEELSIQILVSEGMIKLEDGGAFDLNEEIKEKMNIAYKRIQVHSMLRKARHICEICAAIAIVALVIVLFF